MSREQSLARAGITLAFVALLTAIIAAVTSLLLTSRLSNEDALLRDMDTIVETVTDEAVANTESFLRPAVQTTDFLSAFLADGVLDPNDLNALPLLLDVLRSNSSFDGIFVGSVDGRFLYVNRPADETIAAYESKRISFPNGERTVEVATYDPSLAELSSDIDPTDDFDPRDRVWYKAVIDSGGPAWTDPYVYFSSGLPGVTRANPVYSDQIIEHVVGVDIRLDELSTFMAERAPSPNGAAFIMTKAQLMVAYPDLATIDDGTALSYATQVDDPAVRLAGASMSRDFGGNGDARSGTVDLEGDPAHFVFTELETNDDWVVTAWSPHSDFLTAVRDRAQTNQLIALGLGFVILIELLAAAIWVYRQLSSNHRLLLASEAESARSAAERKRAERELAETVEQLAASNRDLEEYAYAAAHDLRTPLRAIGGYSELIEREVDSDEVDLTRIRGWAEQIVAGYDRMGRTMDNLLEHARLSRVGTDKTEFTHVDTKAIAASAAVDLSTRLEELHGEVHIGDLPTAWADPVQLARVFQNLLENSIRFHHPDRPLRVQIDGAIIDGVVTLTVRDNGVGISSTDKSRIFEAFRKATDDSSGIGLGLALVKRIVEDHGGDIRVESEDGEGTLFEFSLRSAVDARSRVA